MVRGSKKRPARTAKGLDLTAISSMFGHYFEIIRADTDALREEVFRLRYQAYCVETKFENSANFRDPLEKDAFERLVKLKVKLELNL